MTLWTFVGRNLCPACRGKINPPIYRCLFSRAPISSYLEKSYGKAFQEKIGEKEEYVLRECVDCGLVFQGHILSEESMKDLYEQWTGYTSIPTTLDLSKEIESLQEILSMIGYFNSPPHTLSFFDFGMGKGEWASLAQAVGCTTYGFDLSATRIGEAQTRGITILQEYELDKYRFDFINTEQVLEHIPYPLDTLERLKERLTAKGVIKINVPNGRGIKKKLIEGDWMAKKGSKKDLNPVAPIEHINCFNHASIKTMATLAGLRQIHLPLSLQYHYSMRWNTGKWFRKNLIKPIKRTFFSRGTYLLFKRLSSN